MWRKDLEFEVDKWIFLQFLPIWCYAFCVKMENQCLICLSLSNCELDRKGSVKVGLTCKVSNMHPML